MKKSTIRSVWPDLAQNCHFGLNLRIYNQFCEALFSVGKILKLPNLSNCLCQVSFSLAAKNWTNNQAGWSHCFRLTLLCAPVKRSSLSHCTGFSSLSLSCTYFFSLSLSLSLLCLFCLSLSLVPILSLSHSCTYFVFLSMPLSLFLCVCLSLSNKFVWVSLQSLLLFPHIPTSVSAFTPCTSIWSYVKLDIWTFELHKWTVV